MESRCPVLRYRPRQGLHVQTTPAPAEPESEPGSAHGWGWSSPDAARGWSKPSPDAEPSAAPRDAAGGIERTLTSRWLVWLGGVTIALAGVFLVKYSIDRDWLSPVVRCALGVLGGVALTVAGEWSRRRRFQRPSGTVDPSAIPTVLSAAGIATLYSDRYDLLGALALVLVLALFATWDIPRLMDSAGRALGEYGWLYDLGRGPVVPPLLVPFALLSAAFAALFGLAGFFALWRARRPWVWATVSAAAPASLLAVGFWRIQEFGIDLNNVRNRALLDQKQTDESVTKLRAIQHAATTGCSQSTYARPTRGATSTSSRPASARPSRRVRPKRPGRSAARDGIAPIVHWFHRTVCPIIDMANTVADDVEGVHNPKQSRPRYRDEHHDRGEEHGDPHHDPLHAPSLRAQSRPFADLEPLQPWGLPSWPWPPGTSARRGFFGITHTMSLVGYARNLMPDRTLQQARLLAVKEPKRPLHASLRRAVSAPYHALFHLLVDESTGRKSRINTTRLSRPLESTRFRGHLKPPRTTCCSLSQRLGYCSSTKAAMTARHRPTKYWPEWQSKTERTRRHQPAARSRGPLVRSALQRWVSGAQGPDFAEEEGLSSSGAQRGSERGRHTGARPSGS